jgi:hypothetical protein
MHFKGENFFERRRSYILQADLLAPGLRILCISRGTRNSAAIIHRHRASVMAERRLRRDQER